MAVDQRALERQLLEMFVEEANELLQSLNTGLVQLEASDDDAGRSKALDALMGTAHALKGAAGSVNAATVESLAHRLESVFSGLRGGNLTPEAETFDLAYGALDAIREAVDGAPPAEETARIQARAQLEGPETPGDEVREPPSQPTIRVATAKLDSLMAQAGEFLVTRRSLKSRLEEIRDIDRDLSEWQLQLRSGGTIDTAEHSHAEWLAQLKRSLADMRTRFEADERRLSLLTDALQEDVRRTRLVPIDTLYELFPRMVRDLARENDKQVRVSMTGGDVEVGRLVLEEMKGAVTHLVRNSMAHGFESAAARGRAGKPVEGTLSISADRKGGLLELVVEDDGGGIDLSAVVERAVRSGVISVSEADAMPEQSVPELIFRPGLSTSAAINELSGRGIGLDSVRRTIERLNGVIDVSSLPGKGTKFTITVPLTIGVARCLFIRSGGHNLALPAGSVTRIIRTDPGDRGAIGGRPVVAAEEGPVPLVDLARLLGADAPVPTGDAGLAVILGTEQRQVAFAIDEVVGTEEVVIKSLPPPLHRVRSIAGACILGTGQVRLVLSVADLLRHAASTPDLAPVEAEGVAAGQKSSKGPAVIMVVDDSITTRTLERNVLEAAGYRVMTAGDGIEAWETLQRQPCDLLLSDVMMPGLDGFQLTERVRKDERLKHLPVIIVTSLSEPDARRKGADAGADAYFIKSDFDQLALLETVGRLV